MNIVINAKYTFLGLLALNLMIFTGLNCLDNQNPNLWDVQNYEQELLNPFDQLPNIPMNLTSDDSPKESEYINLLATPQFKPNSDFNKDNEGSIELPADKATSNIHPEFNFDIELKVKNEDTFHEADRYLNIPDKPESKAVSPSNIIRPVVKGQLQLASEKLSNDFFIATKKNRLKEFIKDFVIEGGDVNSKLTNGNTLIMQAITLGNNEILRYLLDRGADPLICNHARQFGGLSPLCHAIFCGNSEAVKLLIEKDKTILVNEASTVFDVLELFLKSECTIQKDPFGKKLAIHALMYDYITNLR